MLVHNIDKVVKLYKYMLWYGKLRENPIDFIKVFMDNNNNIKEKLSELYENIHNTHLKHNIISISNKVIGNEILALVKELEEDTKKHTNIENYRVTLDQKDMTEYINDMVDISNINKIIDHIFSKLPIKEYLLKKLKNNIEYYVGKITDNTNVTGYELLNKLSVYKFERPEHIDTLIEYVKKRRKYIENYLDMSNEIKVELPGDFKLVDYKYDLVRVVNNIPFNNESYETIVKNLAKSIYKAKDDLVKYNDYINNVEKIMTETKLVVIDDIFKKITELVTNLKEDKITLKEYEEQSVNVFKALTIEILTESTVLPRINTIRNKYMELAYIIRDQYLILNELINDASRFGEVNA